MSKITVPNRIRTEDFDAESQPLIGKIGPGINKFQDQIVDLINNGKLDFDNLNRQKQDFDVLTDASGNIQTPVAIKLALKSKPYGINIVRLLNINNPDILPNYMPLISFTFNDSILTITSIKGLTSSAKYRFYVEIIGT